jgi:folylpolyglutamate synthase/dihydropteroate synthase
VDADGVALAAIQGLNQKLSEELQQKGTEITELKARMEKLERRINQNNGGAK